MLGRSPFDLPPQAAILEIFGSPLSPRVNLTLSVHEDINECSVDKSVCAYRCRNLLGSYKCLCPPGQKLLADKRSCAGTIVYAHFMYMLRHCYLLLVPFCLIVSSICFVM